MPNGINIIGLRPLVAIPAIDDRAYTPPLGAVISGGLTPRHHDRTSIPRLPHIKGNEDSLDVGKGYNPWVLDRSDGIRIHIDPLIKTWHSKSKEYEGGFSSKLAKPELSAVKLVVNS